MARLASVVKMGFYPTPFSMVECICSFLRTDSKGEFHILDPCCGKGEALYWFDTNVVGGVKIFYGIEPDEERFHEASRYLNRVIHGSIFDARINPLGSMGLLWLNPPYSSEDGERTEMKFLRHSVKWLCDGGILIFIVPEHILANAKNRSWIGANFRRVKIFRFTKEEFARFKQVVLFGIKDGGGREIPPPPYPEIPLKIYPSDERYIIPSTEGPKVFQIGEGITREEIEKFRPRLLAEIRKLLGYTEELKLRSLLPLRKGHLVALLTAGILDGKIETSNGGFILVKGFSDRVTTTWVDEDSGKEIVRNSYSVGIRVMEDGGKWYDIR